MTNTIVFDNTILTCAIMALATIAAAIISKQRTTILSANKRLDSLKEELLKLEAEKIRFAEKMIRMDLLKDNISGQYHELEEFSRSIQDYRDCLSDIKKEAERKKLTKAKALDELSLKMNSMIECFKNSQNLNSSQALAHETKKLAQNVLSSIEFMLKNKKYAIFDDSEKQKIEMFRDELFSYQQILKEKRENLIAINREK